MKKYKILFSLLMLLFAATASAQNEESRYPHAFVGLQGGLLQNYNGQDLSRNWDPMAGVQLGYYFTDVFGTRLQAFGSSWKADLGNGDEFKSKLGSIDLDVLLNLSNVFFPNRNNLVNVIAVVGAPFELIVPHTWVDNYARCDANGDRWNPGWKGGGILELNIAKHWGINLEGGVNYIRQDNSATAGNDKWWPYAMAGLTYKFGYKKAKKAAPIVEEPVVEEQKPEPKPEPKPVVVEKKPEPKPEPVAKPAPAMTTQNLFFKIGRATVTKEHAQKIDEIAQWAKDHPTAQIALTGYADKGTGNARINQALSERRAAAVKDALVKKGVQASRIAVDAKGDTIQPFAQNDDNRAVIVLGEEK